MKSTPPFGGARLQKKPGPLPVAPPDPPIPEPQRRITVLDNGLTVAAFPMPWLHEAGATLFVRGGSRFESDAEGGLSHLLEHMLFKGTRDLPDPTRFHAHLEAMAADMNGATGPEHGAFWITLPPENLEAGFTAFAGMFTQPILEGLETERAVILAEMREDENDQGEITHPGLLAGERLWPGHPLSRSVLGTRESVGRATETDLRDFLARHYCGANLALAFHGPVSHERVLALAERCLGGLPKGKRADSSPPGPMAPGPHIVTVNDQGAQLSLGFFFRAPGYRDDRFHAATALRRLLDDGFASRLQANIRERLGLVYDVGASYGSYSDAGSLEIATAVSPNNLEPVFHALQAEIRRLREEPPGEEEWNRLLIRWRAALVSSLDRPGELQERYAADLLFNAVEPLSDAWCRAAALDRLAMPALAREILRPDNLAVVLTGPEATSRRGDLETWLTEEKGPP